jgi:hypothetical protein
MASTALRMRLSDAQSLLRAVEASRDFLQEEVRRLGDANCSLTEKLSEAQLSASTAQLQAQAASSSLAESQADLRRAQSLQAQAERDRDTAAAAASEAAATSARLPKLEADLSFAKAELAALHTERDRRDSASALLQTEVGRLEGDLDLARRERTKWKARAESARESSRELESTIAALRAENEQLIVHASESASSQTQSTASHADELSHLQGVVETLKTELRCTKAELTAARAETDADIRSAKHAEAAAELARDQALSQLQSVQHTADRERARADTAEAQLQLNDAATADARRAADQAAVRADLAQREVNALRSRVVSPTLVDCTIQTDGPATDTDTDTGIQEQSTSRPHVVPPSLVLECSPPTVLVDVPPSPCLDASAQTDPESLQAEESAPSAQDAAPTAAQDAALDAALDAAEMAEELEALTLTLAEAEAARDEALAEAGALRGQVADLEAEVEELALAAEHAPPAPASEPAPTKSVPGFAHPAELVKLKLQLAALQAKYDKDVETLKEHAKKLARMAADAVRAREQAVAAEAIATANADLAALSAELGVAEEALGDLEAQLAEATAARDAAQAALVRERAAREYEVQAPTVSSAPASGEIEELQSELTAVLTELTSAEETRDAAISEAAELKNLVAEMESALSSYAEAETRTTVPPQPVATEPVATEPVATEPVATESRGCVAVPCLLDAAAQTEQPASGTDIGQISSLIRALEAAVHSDADLRALVDEFHASCQSTATEPASALLELADAVTALKLSWQRTFDTSVAMFDDFALRTHAMLRPLKAASSEAGHILTSAHDAVSACITICAMGSSTPPAAEFEENSLRLQDSVIALHRRLLRTETQLQESSLFPSASSADAAATVPSTSCSSLAHLLASLRAALLHSLCPDVHFATLLATQTRFVSTADVLESADQARALARAASNELLRLAAAAVTETNALLASSQAALNERRHLLDRLLGLSSPSDSAEVRALVSSRVAEAARERGQASEARALLSHAQGRIAELETANALGLQKVARLERKLDTLVREREEDQLGRGGAPLEHVLRLAPAKLSSALESSLRNQIKLLESALADRDRELAGLRPYS